MNEDDFGMISTPNPMPAAAAKSAGIGLLALFALLGFCAWKKFNR